MGQDLSAAQDSLAVYLLPSSLGHMSPHPSGDLCPRTSGALPPSLTASAASGGRHRYSQHRARRQEDPDSGLQTKSQARPSRGRRCLQPAARPAGWPTPRASQHPPEPEASPGASLVHKQASGRPGLQRGETPSQHKTELGSLGKSSTFCPLQSVESPVGN